MSIMYAAADRCGNDVLIIRDNQIVGKAKSVLQRGDLFVGIELLDDAAKSLIDITKNADLQSLGYRHIYIKYDPITGNFLPDENFKEVREAMKDTMIVDEFNFRWGMVPEKFRDVPGYRAACLRNMDSN